MFFGGGAGDHRAASDLPVPTGIDSETRSGLEQIMNIQTRDGRIRDESEAAQAVSKAIALDALRARLRALEVGSTASPIETAVPFGVSEVDSLLPWGGLPVACLHEVLGDGTGAGEGFCAMLKARLSAIQRPALWCLARADLHAPGLGTFGLVPDRLIIVRGRSAGDVAWAMEEGLRSGCVGAVLGELRALDLRAGRRLQLAARAGGVTCLVLRRNEERLMPGVAVTRWRIVAAPVDPKVPTEIFLAARRVGGSSFCAAGVRFPGAG